MQEGKIRGGREKRGCKSDARAETRGERGEERVIKMSIGEK